MKKSLISKICKCGVIIEQSENEFVPIVEKSNGFFLVFSDGREQNIRFCFFCGGNELGPATEQIDKCNCYIVEKWLKSMVSPIKFDVQFHEYYLEGKDTSSSIFYFCPICGGRLPESKRDDFFHTPSEAEIDKIRKKVKNATTINELIKILGVPNEKVITNSEAEKQNSLGKKSVKQTLVYNSIADSFSLIVVEDEDEKIHFLFAGKPKNTD
jgi:hypothetical protein